MSLETITASAGDELSVPLKATPSTGYVWEVDPLPKEVQFLGCEYEKSTEGAQPGDPVVQVFRFRISQRGEYTIGFSLKRQWEKNAIDSYTVKVTID